MQESSFKPKADRSLRWGSNRAPSDTHHMLTAAPAIQPLFENHPMISLHGHNVIAGHLDGAATRSGDYCPVFSHRHRSFGANDRI
jgi:hypothetical protein